MPSEYAKILLIEDDPLHAQLLEAMIVAESGGFEPVVETRLESGLARLAQNDIDLVLLDLTLPDSEGLETLLKTHEHSPHLPILVLTTAGDGELARRAMMAGAQDHLIKWEMDHRLLQQTMRYAIERQRAVLARQEHERTIRRIADALPEIIVLIEPQTGKMSFINDQVTRTLGYSIAEAQTLTYKTLVHPDDQQRLSQHFDRLLAEPEKNDVGIEYRVKHANGEWRWLDSRHIVYGRRQEGRPVQILCAAHDTTQRKQLEAEIHRTQRLESIGALASGIAHDLNNVLAPILMALHTLQQRFTDEYSQRWLSLLNRSAVRGRDLIEQMIAFARGASGERTPLQLKGLTEDLVKILNETLPRNVELSVRVPDDLWIVIGDGTQIHQVLMNLSINARDAMPDGGKLSITAENITLGEGEVRVHPDVKPGRFIRITVADTGIGISPQIFDRIFDPFFTTKEKGKGTGLGLSTVLGITRGHGGFIEVQSEVARGSQFHIYLPAREITVPGAREIPSQGPLSGRGELILVVDDEPDICEVTKHTLESCGYRVLAAYDGQEAVEIFRRYQNEIEVVLTDMIMPNLDGPATIRALKEIDPQVKIIAASGIRSASPAEMINSDIDIFLPKPFTAEILLGILSNLLHR